MHKTKKSIREAYIALLQEKDTPKITITEIARRADIDRKTFYLHYDSIEDVVHEFGRHEMERLILQLEQNEFFENVSDVAVLFRTLNELMEENIKLYRHIAETPSFSFLWGEIKNIIKASLIETMEERLDISQEELEIYAEFYASGTIGTYLQWLRGELPVTDERLAEIIADAAYYGFQKLRETAK